MNFIYDDPTGKINYIVNVHIYVAIIFLSCDPS